MGSQTLVIWDEEIADCFDLWGGRKIAVYFEALRYRQQLTKGEFFAYASSHLERNTGLTYKQQLSAKKVLEGSGWIETTRKQNHKKGSSLYYRLTDLAFEATKHIKRPRNLKDLRQELVKGFTRNYNMAR